MASRGYSLASHLLATLHLSRDGKRSILLVEPNEEDARRLCSILQKEGSVTLVASAQSALAAAERHAPNLIVQELDLPDDDGFELIARLRELSSVRSSALMIISRRVGVADKIRAMRAGADGYLVKPATDERLRTQARLLLKYNHFIRE